MVRFLVVLLALSLVLTAGCRRRPYCPPGKVCLRYMAWGNPQQLDVEREMVTRFNEENPDVHVTLFTTPGSAYMQKMITMLASRTAPDILRVDHYRFPQLVERDYFVDLTPYAEADPTYDAGDFFPTAIEEGTVDGKLYGLNALYGGILIYYNKTLFEQNGLEDPYELYQRGEWTWDRFRESAIAMTRYDERGRPQVFGCTLPYFPASVPIVYAFGGRLMSDDMQSSRVDDPATIRAFQFLADLRWVDEVAPTPAQAANAAFTFESGKVGMVFDWMGMTPRFREVATEFEWDVVPLPSGPAGHGFIVKGNQLVIASNSEHPEEAWRFIRFLTGEATEMRLYAEIRRAFPTRIAVANSPEYLETDQPPFHMRAFVQSVENARTLPINERWPEWTQIMNSELDNLFSGRERDAGVAMRRAKADIDKLLAEDPGF